MTEIFTPTFILPPQGGGEYRDWKMLGEL